MHNIMKNRHTFEAASHSEDAALETDDRIYSGETEAERHD